MARSNSLLGEWKETKEVPAGNGGKKTQIRTIKVIDVKGEEAITSDGERFPAIQLMDANLYIRSGWSHIKESLPGATKAPAPAHQIDAPVQPVNQYQNPGKEADWSPAPGFNHPTNTPSIPSTPKVSYTSDQMLLKSAIDVSRSKGKSSDISATIAMVVDFDIKTILLTAETFGLSTADAVKVISDHLVLNIDQIKKDFLANIFPDDILDEMVLETPAPVEPQPVIESVDDEVAPGSDPDELDELDIVDEDKIFFTNLEEVTPVQNNIVVPETGEREPADGIFIDLIGGMTDGLVFAVSHLRSNMSGIPVSQLSGQMTIGEVLTSAAGYEKLVKYVSEFTPELGEDISSGKNPIILASDNPDVIKHLPGTISVKPTTEPEILESNIENDQPADVERLVEEAKEKIDLPRLPQFGSRLQDIWKSQQNKK